MESLHKDMLILLIDKYLDGKQHLVSGISKVLRLRMYGTMRAARIYCATRGAIYTATPLYVPSVVKTRIIITRVFSMLYTHCKSAVTIDYNSYFQHVCVVILLGLLHVVDNICIINCSDITTLINRFLTYDFHGTPSRDQFGDMCPIMQNRGHTLVTWKDNDKMIRFVSGDKWNRNKKLRKRTDVVITYDKWFSHTTFTFNVDAEGYRKRRAQ